MRWIREHSWAGIHSCFCSVGDRTVVILPSFTIALFKGNPFLYPTHQTPPPPSPPLLSSLPSYLLYIQREQSSPAAKQGEEKILWTVKAISYKMMYGEMMATVMHRNKHTHAHYSDKVWWESGLDGPTVEIKLLLFISLLDIESLESGQ